MGRFVLDCKQIRGTKQRLICQDLLVVSIAAIYALLYAQQTMKLLNRRGLTARHRRYQMLVVVHVSRVVHVKVVDHGYLTPTVSTCALHALDDLIVIAAQWVQTPAAPFN